MRSDPLYRPLCCLSLGWIVGEWIEHVCGHGPYWIVMLLIWILACLYYCRYMKNIPVILLIIGITTGAAYLNYVDENNYSFFPTSQIGEGWGVIRSEPSVDGDRLRFNLELYRFEANHRIIEVPAETILVSSQLSTLTEQKQAEQINADCLVRLPLALTRPNGASNPGAFDYAEYLRHYHIYWQTEEHSFFQIHFLSCRRTFTTTIQHVRKTLSNRLALLFPRKQAGLLQEMLLGQQQTLDPSTLEVFSSLGLVHVLSISGLHVAVLVGFLYFLLTLFGCTREKAALILIGILPLYVVLTGSSAPIVRSAIMAGFLLLAIVLRKTSDALSFLSLALLLQLLWNPYQLWEPGFQLSFLVTAGLLTIVEPLTHAIPLLWYRVRQAIAVMLVTQALSFHVIISYFYQYSWVSGIVNLLFVPLYSTIIFPLSTISLLLSFLWFDCGGWIAHLTSWLIGVINQCLIWCTKIPNAVISISPPSFWWLVCYGTVVWWTYVATIHDRPHLRKTKWISIPVLLFLLLFSIWGNSWFRKNTTVTMIDVGQGDSSLIETADGYVMLIDGGGTLPRREADWQKRIKPFEVGRDAVVPYLRYRGINHIDTIMMTHGDGDHIRGLEAVINRIPVGRVLHNSAPAEDAFEQHLFQLIRQKHISLQVAARGDSWQLDQGIEATILHPDLTFHAANANNGSLVMLLSVYGTKLMFTGDMEEPSEQDVLAHYHLPQVDILKVAHHGSNTSSHDAWLAAIRPRYALISVGIHNRYGHPNPETLARLHKYGAQIYRTDRQGAIVVTIGKTGYKIESTKGEK